MVKKCGNLTYKTEYCAPKMSDNEFFVIDKIRQQIVSNNLSLKALIQDIYDCSGPLEVLNELSDEGRLKLALFKKQVDQLEYYAYERTGRERLEMVEEVKNLREQYTSTLGSFRKANVLCMLTIDKSNKEELFRGSDGEPNMRLRQKKDKANLVKMSSNVTEQLRSISRHLAETTQRSCDTLETLANSSSNVTAAQEELHSTGT
ncbi:vesicle transport protein Sec20 isoform X2 [Lycorma delicatula]|uniref:vesicle transport protein Sec20 isoform X2 n=1 Tax=Lycorma delicatula TaxID=130591 RepID=UPI003F50ED53